MASNWRVCIFRAREHEATPSVFALWLGRKKQRFSGTNQKPVRSDTEKSLIVESFLAYGGWARSTSGSQNLCVLTKRYDNSLFFPQVTKINTVRKLLRHLLVVPGLIWRGSAYFVQHTRRYSTNNERVVMPSASNPFLAQKEKLRNTKWSIFFTFCKLVCFLKM